MSLTTLYGLRCRTRNDPNNTDIPRLFETFVKTYNPSKIYSVYTNYQSDHTGEFDYFVGSEDYRNLDKLEISDQKYITFDVDPSPQNVWDKWCQINSQKNNRSFKTDYELYHDGKCTIYVGIIS